jgi:hypothetical protein
MATGTLLQYNMYTIVLRISYEDRERELVASSKKINISTQASFH